MGQKKISEFFEKLLLAGMGAKKVSEEKIKEIVDELVKKGEILKEERQSYFDKLYTKAESIRKEFDDRISELIRDLLEKMEVPTKNDVEILKRRIEELEKKVAEQAESNASKETQN